MQIKKIVRNEAAVEAAVTNEAAEAQTEVAVQETVATKEKQARKGDYFKNNTRKAASVDYKLVNGGTATQETFEAMIFEEAQKVFPGMLLADAIRMKKIVVTVIDKITEKMSLRLNPNMFIKHKEIANKVTHGTPVNPADTLTFAHVERKMTSYINGEKPANVKGTPDPKEKELSIGSRQFKAEDGKVYKY